MPEYYTLTINAKTPVTVVKTQLLKEKHSILMKMRK